MAKALSSSSMVPDRYRGDANLGSCMIALEISNRIGMNVLAVMQNLYDVHGKPAWSSQFLIACVNASRKFSPLRYRMTGDKSNDSYGCIAWATDSTGEKLESPEITMSIAKAEGWYQKNGSKWKTMPELMLRYRTATLFARLYAPELTMGIRTDDEVVDIVEVAPVVTEPQFGPKKKEAKPTVHEAVIVTPAAEPNPSTPPPTQEPKPHAPAFHNTAIAQPKEPVAQTTPEPVVESPKEPTFEQVVDGQASEADPLAGIRAKMNEVGVTEEKLVLFYNTNKGPTTEAVTTLNQIHEQSLARILTSKAMVARIKALP